MWDKLKNKKVVNLGRRKTKDIDALMLKHQLISAEVLCKKGQEVTNYFLRLQRNI